VKESLKKHVPEKSYRQNGKNFIELIRIIPSGVIRITPAILAGD
jgi:hypothetical protein